MEANQIVMWNRRKIGTTNLQSQLRDILEEEIGDYQEEWLTQTVADMSTNVQHIVDQNDAMRQSLMQNGHRVVYIAHIEWNTLLDQIERFQSRAKQ